MRQRLKGAKKKKKVSVRATTKKEEKTQKKKPASTNDVAAPTRTYEGATADAVQSMHTDHIPPPRPVVDAKGTVSCVLPVLAVTEENTGNTDALLATVPVEQVGANSKRIARTLPVIAVGSNPTPVIMTLDELESGTTNGVKDETEPVNVSAKEHMTEEQKPCRRGRRRRSRKRTNSHKR